MIAAGQLEDLGLELTAKAKDHAATLESAGNGSRYLA